jgi:hypothetical protein
MKIRFRVDGGFAVFPGLARPVTIDVDSLPAADAEGLRAAVGKCRFFDRAEPAATKQALPDLRRYEVTVEDGTRSRTLTIPETDDDADLKALIGLLQEQRTNALRR